MRCFLFAIVYAAASFGVASAQKPDRTPAAPVVEAAEIDPAALAAARRLVVAARAEQNMLEIMDRLIPVMLGPVANAHGLSEAQQAVIARLISDEIRRDPAQLVDMIAHVYARHLSAEDLIWVTEFYESERGERFLQAQSRMAPELQAIGAEWAQQILVPRLQRRLEELSRNPPEGPA